MNKNELVKNLIQDIQDLYSIANRLENHEQIHPLDIDLALSKVRNLYELLLKLNPQAIYPAEYQKKEIPTIPKQAEKKIEFSSSQKASTEPCNEPIKQEETKKETEDETKLITDPPSKKEEIIKPEPSQIIEVKKEIIETKYNTSSPEIVADKFQSKKFVHENISTKNPKKDVSTKLQSKPIKDINSAIGLNDKFIFIRELFNGDKDQYQETIQLLNNFDTYENALEFLSENFDWDSEDSNFERLKELVRRKYS